MKHLCVLILVLVLNAPRAAFAFGGSETDQMKEDVREALNRARDFNSQRVREATEELVREKGAKDAVKRRAEFEIEQEDLRKEFVRERNAQPSEFLTQAKLERDFNERQIIEDRNMEKARVEYERKHRKVQRIIDRKAHINEAQEYGL